MNRFCLSFIALLCWTQIVAAQSTIFLVRHAEKAAATNSSDPDLSSAGRARAALLARILTDVGLKKIYATEFKRTQQTARPTAKATRITVTILPAADTAGLISKLKQMPGNALVVGHSNTVPDIIRGLGISTPVTIAENEYDNLFVVCLGSSPQLIRLHY